MKKFFITVFVITFMFILTACGTKKSDAYKGVWKYERGGNAYSVELLDNDQYILKQGDAKREGPYTVKEENGVLYITLEYNKTYGYMKYENDKMCALTTEKGSCDFYFER